MNTRTDVLDGTAAPTAPTIAPTRWLQLGLGLVCMMTISSPQYVWTLMTKPLTAKLGIPCLNCRLPSRFSCCWVLASYAHSVPMLYLTYGGVGGLGTGIVSVGVVGLMVRWFPDRRGFAAGAVASDALTN